MRHLTWRVRRLFRKPSDAMKTKAAREMYQFKIDSLSEEQLSDLREAFKLFDKDSDGTIDSKELGTLMRSIGENPSDDEIAEMINKTDIDGSGAIEFPEFILLMEERLKESIEEDLYFAFRAFDQHGKGVVSLTEIKEIMLSITERVTISEMLQIMKNIPNRSKDEIPFVDFINMLYPFGIGTNTSIGSSDEELNEINSSGC